MTTMLPLARHSDSLWCRAQGSLATASYWEKRSFRELRCSTLVRGLQGAVLREPQSVSHNAALTGPISGPLIAGTFSRVRIELQLLIESFYANTLGIARNFRLPTSRPWAG
jgi:hypothetical protein